MSNKKISALTLAATPLAGTELVPLVQSGATDSVTVANLTAGRSVSASDYVMSAGNLVPIAGKGVNFTANTPAAGKTSQLFNWYEEGTWTPIFVSTGAAFTYAEQYGSYTKIGAVVTLQFRLRTTSATGTLSNPVYVSGLPFNSANLNANNTTAGSIGLCDISGGININISNNDSVITIWNLGTITQTLASGISSKFFVASISYRTS